MRLLLVLFLILIANTAYSSPAEERPEHRIPILDSAQELFGARANFAANRLDSFFATERADDEFGRSRIRIRSNFDIREREKSDLDIRYRVNLRLPHLEEKFKWQYVSDKEEKRALEKKEKKETPDEEKEKISRHKIFQDWLFNSDIGVSVAIPPKLITRARVRRNIPTGTIIHRFSEQLTYITDESGLVEETTLHSDHIFSEDVLFRFVNYKRWEVLQKDFLTSHGPTLLQRLNIDEAFNYGFLMSSVIDNGIWFVDNYRLSVNYRRNLYQQWVYFDVIPGIDFPKVWSFRRTPFISFQLELLFGGK